MPKRSGVLSVISSDGGTFGLHLRPGSPPTLRIAASKPVIEVSLSSALMTLPTNAGARPTPALSCLGLDAGAGLITRGGVKLALAVVEP